MFVYFHVPCLWIIDQFNATKTTYHCVIGPFTHPISIWFPVWRKYQRIFTGTKNSATQKNFDKVHFSFSPSQLQSCNNAFVPILPAYLSLLMSVPTFLLCWSFCKYHYPFVPVQHRFSFYFLSCNENTANSNITFYRFNCFYWGKNCSSLSLRLFICLKNHFHLKSKTPKSFVIAVFY